MEKRQSQGPGRRRVVARDACMANRGHVQVEHLVTNKSDLYASYDISERPSSARPVSPGPSPFPLSSFQLRTSWTHRCPQAWFAFPSFPVRVRTFLSLTFKCSLIISPLLLKARPLPTIHSLTLPGLFCFFYARASMELEREQASMEIDGSTNSSKPGRQWSPSWPTQVQPYATCTSDNRILTSIVHSYWTL